MASVVRVARASTSTASPAVTIAPAAIEAATSRLNDCTSTAAPTPTAPAATLPVAQKPPWLCEIASCARTVTSPPAVTTPLRVATVSPPTSTTEIEPETPASPPAPAAASKREVCVDRASTSTSPVTWTLLPPSTQARV